MLFHSNLFVVGFLPFAFLAYLLARPYPNIRLGVIIISSLVFYSYWNWHHTPLLIFSILVNYWIYKKILSQKKDPKKIFSLVTLGVAVDLGILAWFKYRGWFTHLGGNESEGFQFAAVAIPIGISFYTFQQISCLVDAARQAAAGKQKDHYSLLEYSAYVMFFPQLIAGPIVRSQELIGQFRQKLSSDRYLYYVALGFIFFLVGYIKKTYLADNLSIHVNIFFDKAAGGPLEFREAFLATFSYAFQIYFDFSGYADMAIGLGLLFGLKLPVNFASPFRATSPMEYWRRWHITLSVFLRDYVFSPLSLRGSRKGILKSWPVWKTRLAGQQGPLMVTFILSGIWHGANSTFLVWGIYHGVLVLINDLWRKTRIKIPVFISFPATLYAIALSFIFFRAPNLDVAMRVFNPMISISWHDILEYRNWIRMTGGMIDGAGLLRMLSPVPFEGADVGRSMLFMTFAFWICMLLPNLNRLLEFEKAPRFLSRPFGFRIAACTLCILVPVILIAIVNYMSVIGVYFPEIKFVYFDF